MGKTCITFWDFDVEATIQFWIFVSKLFRNALWVQQCSFGFSCQNYFAMLIYGAQSEDKQFWSVIEMARADHCAFFHCSNESKLSFIMSEFCDFTYRKAQNTLVNGRDCLTVAIKTLTEVCFNHFKAGFRSKKCPNLALYLRRYI